MTTLTIEAVHAGRWWCPYDRAWMSATLKRDVDGESFVSCLNCREVIVRLRPGAAARPSGTPSVRFWVASVVRRWLGWQPI